MVLKVEGKKKKEHKKQVTTHCCNPKHLKKTKVSMQVLQMKC